MIAEYTIGLILFAFGGGYILGDSHGRRIQRTREWLRVRRIFNGVGGMRDW